MTASESRIQEALAAIDALEAKRCRALVAGDKQAMASVMADECVVFHGSGVVEGKADFVKNIFGRLDVQSAEFRKTHFRLYGDVAVYSGVLDMMVRLRTAGPDFMRALANVSQVWNYSNGTWKMVNYHATRLPPTS